MVDCALMAKNTDKHKRLIELPRFVWDALDKEAERCKRTPLKHLDAILTDYFQLGDVELSDLESVRAHNNPDSPNKGKPSDYQASIKKKKDNSHLSVASAKTIVEQWEELCKLSGEDVPVDALVMYTQYNKKGDSRFLTDYPERVQELVNAYKEGRIEEYLSEQAAEEKTAG